MPSFGTTSKKRLNTVHSVLQEIFYIVIEMYDCTILKGHRGEVEQNQAFDEGNSEKRWPDGTHNKNPSWGVDAGPWPLDWNDLPRFHYFAGIVKGVALAKGIKIRWGGDWDNDMDLSEHTLKDLVHFELIE